MRLGSTLVEHFRNAFLPLTLLAFALSSSACATRADAELGELQSELVGPGPNANVAFAYDALGRLRTVEYPSVAKRVVHAYDVNGNRTSVTIDANVSSTTTPPVP
jgi:hypothetical protein